jgi:hypothetical protein
MSIWFNMTTNDEQVAMGMGSNGYNGARFTLYYTGKAWCFEAENLGGSFGWTNDRKWHMLTTTIPPGGDITRSRIYLDGVIQAVSPPGEGTVNVDAAGIFAVGKNPAENLGSYFHGSLEEVRIYDIELSQAQVAALYNDTK